MKAVFCVLALTFAVSLAASNDDKCKNDFQSFLKCVKDQYEAKPQSEKDAAKKERQDKATKCFADAGCDAPDYSKDPSGGMMGGQHGKGMDMPESVKKCLKDKLVAKVGEELNKCLTQKGISNVNFSQIADSVQGAGFGVDGDASAGKEGIQGSAAVQFNVVQAVDKCSQKKGGPGSVKPLEQCLQKIKHDEKPKICALIKPCQDKLSADCKKRGQAITKALCECKKDKELEIAGKLRKLGTDNAKVPISDLINTAAGDQTTQDLVKSVDQCYMENNEKEPPMLKAVLQLFVGSGSAKAGLSAKIAVNGSTLVVLADMMQLDAEDKSECEPCA